MMTNIIGDAIMELKDNKELETHLVKYTDLLSTGIVEKSRIKYVGPLIIAILIIGLSLNILSTYIIVMSRLNK